MIIKPKYAAPGGGPLNCRLISTAARAELRPPRQARVRLCRRDVPLAPSAGWSGLPKEPAFAADTVIAAPMVDAANTFLGNMVAMNALSLRGPMQTRRSKSDPFCCGA